MFTADFKWTPSRVFQLTLANQLSAAFASEVKPANTFSAELKLFPVPESKLFTSLEFKTIYQSMTTPTTNSTVTAQVGQTSNQFSEGRVMPLFRSEAGPF